MKNIFSVGALIVVFFAVVVPIGDAQAAVADVSHTVVNGDNLHLLAGYYYCDPRLWMEIYRANKKLIRNASVLSPGMVLTIPAGKMHCFPMAYNEWREKVRR